MASKLQVLPVVFAGLALLLSALAIVGAAYVLRYRVERLEKDHWAHVKETKEQVTALSSELQKLNGTLASLDKTLAIFNAREQAYDHEDRIAHLEAVAKCGDCVNFRQRQQSADQTT